MQITLKKENNMKVIMKIDKGIEIPNPYKDKRKYPFEEMEIGDSILFCKENDRVAQGRAANRVFMWRSHNKAMKNRKYITRKTKQGIRIWRTK